MGFSDGRLDEHEEDLDEDFGVPSHRLRCAEVHPLYSLRCTRYIEHSGPCMHVVFWNEE